MTNIVITLEGGVIQFVDSDQPLKVIILDVDNDSVDDPKTSKYTDLNGKQTEAVVSIHEGSDLMNPKIVQHIFKQLSKPV